MTSALPPAPPSVEPPGWPPPPPPAGPPARPQLRRSRTDKILGGVSGGLAEYSGVDALLWRVGFVALAFAGGTGVIVYLLLWLLMPAAPIGAPGVPRTAAPAVERRPKGPRSPVPRITIATGLIVLGVLVLISRFTGVDFGPRAFFGSALLVVGLGLIAAAFADGRRARGGLIALGVVLSLALISSTSAPWHDVDGDIGDRVYRPTSAIQVQDDYRGGIGDMTLDLTDVDVSDLSRQITTRIDAGVGDVTVLVPRSADVQVSVDSGIGSVSLFGEDGRTGGFFAGSGTGTWVDDGDPEIELLVNAGIGNVEVSRG